MPAPLTHLALFGTPRILRGGDEVAMPVRNTLALFVFIAREGRFARARLCELLWSSLDEPTARRNLRHALHRLRPAGLGDVLAADNEQVGLVGVSNDLQLFEAAVASSRLEEACAIRTAAFLDGLDVGREIAFEDWLRRRRQRFVQAWQAAMTEYAVQCERQGDLRTAVSVHRRLLDDDALQEGTYRELMRLHDALGERALAPDTFARCQQHLRDELGLEPLPETLMLAGRIRTRESRGPAAVVDQPAAVTVRRAPPVFDPSQMPLEARERELAAFAALAAPLILVEGDAGVGKTRFAVEAVGHAAQALSSEALLVRFTPMSSSTPFDAVADALRSIPARERISALEPLWRRDITATLSSARGIRPAPTRLSARTW